jgi:hypothetical protein
MIFSTIFPFPGGKSQNEKNMKVNTLNFVFKKSKSKAKMRRNQENLGPSPKTPPKCLRENVLNKVINKYPERKINKAP